MTKSDSFIGKMSIGFLIHKVKKRLDQICLGGPDVAFSPVAFFCYIATQNYKK